MNYTCKYNSPIGEINLASDGQNLIGLWLKGQNMPTEEMECKEDLEVFIKTRKWLDEYFKGIEPTQNIPLKLEGTKFRKEVWNILLKIPYGKTITYGDIAKELAKRKGIKKMSAQAIGGAVGHNPISIIVPCHRVIGANGKLTGYAGGIDLKEKLLKIEGILKVI